MTEPQAPFGLMLSNIPIINLRREFEAHYRLLGTEQFRAQLYDFTTPVELPQFKWTGLPDDLLTMMLQRAILGVESYLGAAVEYELTMRQRFTDENKKKMNNPFRLGGESTVENFYDKLPGLIDGSFLLSNSDPRLYQEVKEFYKSIRNPLFHGHQLAHATPSQIASAFDLIRSIYKWIDRWYSAFPNPDFGGGVSTVGCGE